MKRIPMQGLAVAALLAAGAPVQAQSFNDDPFLDPEGVELRTPEYNEYSVTLEWVAPGCDDGYTHEVGERVARYEVRHSNKGPNQYGILPSNWWTELSYPSGPAPEPELRGTLQRFKVTGLPPGISLTFAIKAFDAFNNESYSWTFTPVKTRPADVDPPGSVDLAVAGRDAESITLTFVAPSEDPTTPYEWTEPSVSTYDLRLRKIGDGETVVPGTVDWELEEPVTAGLPAPSLPGTTERIRVAGLERGATYCFALRSSDGSNWSDWSESSAAGTVPDDGENHGGGDGGCGAAAPGTAFLPPLLALLRRYRTLPPGR